MGAEQRYAAREEADTYAVWDTKKRRWVDETRTTDREDAISTAEALNKSDAAYREQYKRELADGTFWKRFEGE